VQLVAAVGDEQAAERVEDECADGASAVVKDGLRLVWLQREVEAVRRAWEEEHERRVGHTGRLGGAHGPCAEAAAPIAAVVVLGRAGLAEQGGVDPAEGVHNEPVQLGAMGEGPPVDVYVLALARPKCVQWQRRVAIQSERGGNGGGTPPVGCSSVAVIY
jgi:hypothetical protein